MDSVHTIVSCLKSWRTGLGILSPKSITTDDDEDCDDDSLLAIQGYTAILLPLRRNSGYFSYSRNTLPFFFPPSATSSHAILT